MRGPEITCWTVIRGAAEGRAEDRAAFARRYQPVLRSYLAARWKETPWRNELEDAIQDIFVELFREGGALERVQEGRPGGFQAYLYGVARNVARRTERSRAKSHARAEAVDLDRLDADEDGLSTIFDRAWAKMQVAAARERQEEHARDRGGDALRRIQILQLRFQEGLPIREIAARWSVDPALLHHEYAKARREFRSALLDVIAFHRPGAAAELEQECTRILSLLA